MRRFGDYSLLKSGTPGGIRTPNPLVRSQVLYPVELRVQEIFEPQAKPRLFMIFAVE